MNNTNEHIEQLILRQLTNEATGAELAELQQWLDASPDNQEEYASLRLIWESSREALQPPVFETAAAWKKLEQRRRVSMTPEPMRGIEMIDAEPEPAAGAGLRWRVLLAAAAVVLLTAGGWLLYQHVGTPEMVEIAA